MHFQAEALGQCGAGADQLAIRLSPRAARPSMSASHQAPVWISITGAPERTAASIWRGCGADKQRNADAGMFELGTDRRQLIVLAGGVEPAFGGALGALFRHQADRVRRGLERDLEHFLGRRHFEIERLVDLGLQPRHVVVADVAAVLAQMRGDAVGSRPRWRAWPRAPDRDGARRARCGWWRRGRH